MAQPFQPSGLAVDLDKLRRSAGFSYRDLARRTGCPRSTLHDALTGRRFPRLDTVLAVARACGDDEARWRTRWVTADQQRTPGSAELTPIQRQHALEQLLQLLEVSPDQIAKARSAWIDTDRAEQTAPQRDRGGGVLHVNRRPSPAESVRLTCPYGPRLNSEGPSPSS